MHFATYRFLGSLLAAACLLAGSGTALAQQEPDPPSRVGMLSYSEGSVVFAPAGEEDWTPLTQNRPLTMGDRLWTDAGARAELQLGSATVHVNSESHLGIVVLDERGAQFILKQGAVNARVRELAPGENFEIGTPNLAFRANQPGDYRIDIKPDGSETRVTVESGMATLYGEGGQSLNMGAGQQVSFAGRFLAQVYDTPSHGDAFSRWAGERNRAEDQSLAARHVPRGVVGYAQLDQNGSWSQDPQYGEVWYPTVAATDWAPYRYGQWAWVGPWGWTWVDDAPWGFAPFHYGRWTVIGTRWAWVPGQMAARPLYSPALVVFMGNSGSRVGWYPLAPGEAWRPTYRSSARYLNAANINIDVNARRGDYNHLFGHRPWAMTAVREEEFRNGRSVRSHWQPVAPGSFTQVGVAPPRPERRMQAVQPGAPRLQERPPTGQQSMQLPSRFWAQGQREPQAGAQQQPQPQQRPQQQPVQVQQQPRFVQADRRAMQAAPAPQLPAQHTNNAPREQWQAQREQDRLQWDAERAAHEQRRGAEVARRQQTDLVQRQQQDAARHYEAIRQQHEANQQRIEQQLPPTAQPPQFQRQRHQQQGQPGRWERDAREEGNGGRGRWNRG